VNWSQKMLKTKTKVIKLGNLVLPPIEDSLEDIRLFEFTRFELSSTSLALPSPEYVIEGIVEEFSFSQLSSIMAEYRGTLDEFSQQDLVIGIINRSLERNYFSFLNRSANCAVISVHDVENVLGGISLSTYLLSAIVENCIAAVEEHGWHAEPRRCMFDFCGDRRDITVSLTYFDLCDECKERLSDNAMSLIQRTQNYVHNKGREKNTMNEINRVLFITADPTEKTRLRIQKEHREISSELAMSMSRDAFNFDAFFAVRPADLSRAILSKPRAKFIHFSGHGSNAGAICLEDDIGQTKIVNPTVLATILEPLGTSTECIVLNACYSVEQAEELVKVVPNVIGMNSAISDKAAIAFSIGFYQALFSNENIVTAHKLGCAQIHMVCGKEYETPILLNC